MSNVVEAINSHFLTVTELRKRKDMPEGPLRLLFVDDDQDCLFAIKQVCKTYGQNCTLLETAEAALETIKADPDGFDIAFIDIKLPGMNGVDLLKAIKSLVPTPNFPIVFLTAYPNFQQLESALDYGYMGLLAKPCGIEELTDVLRKHRLVP